MANRGFGHGCPAGIVAAVAGKCTGVVREAVFRRSA
jgi:hypothetical protein